MRFKTEAIKKRYQYLMNVKTLAMFAIRATCGHTRGKKVKIEDENINVTEDRVPFVYHITLSANSDSILSKGIVPSWRGRQQSFHSTLDPDRWGDKTQQTPHHQDPNAPRLIPYQYDKGDMMIQVVESARKSGCVFTQYPNNAVCCS